MSTVIDSLVVTLALDPTKLTDGQREAIKAFQAAGDKAKDIGADMERSGAKAAAFFGQITDKVLGLAAAYVGLNAVKSVIVDTTNATAQLARTAQLAGVDLKNLAAFTMAVARNGGDQNTAAQQVSGLVQSLQNAKLGNVDPNLMRFLGYIGAGVNDDPLEILKKFSDFAKANESNPALIARIGAFGGLTDTATLTELMKGRSALNADLQRSAQLGVPTKQDAEAARDLQKSFVGLEQAVDTLTRDIVTEFSPVLIKFFDWMAKSIGVRGDTLSNAGAAAGATAGMFLGGVPGAVAGTAAGGVFGALMQGEADERTRQIEEFGGYFDPLYGFIAVPGAKGSTSVRSALAAIKKLEGSGPGSVSNKGAVGTYQILPSTAQQYGLDPSRLKDPAYNEYAASVILSDLLKRYNGDMEAVAIAYHSGPGAANAYLARGRDPNVLGPKGRDYLAREQRLGSSTVNINGPITVTTRATDVPTGTAQGVRRALENSGLSVQANTGLQ